MDDFVITEYLDADGSPWPGKVFLVFGSSLLNTAASINTLPSVTVLVGANATQSIGLSASAVGDLNGDGLADFAIGQRNGADESDFGRMVVFFGRVTWPASLNVTNNPADTVSFLGSATWPIWGSVAGVGDVNGDSMDDMLIGSPYTAMQDHNGAILVFGKASGDPFPPSVAMADVGTSGLGVNFECMFINGCGFSVAGLGDVTNDGMGDIAISAHDGGNKVYIVPGRSTWEEAYVLDTEVSVFTLTGDGFSNFGFTVAGVGDVNGDSFNDTVVRAQSSFPSKTYVFFGPLTGTASVDDMGSSGGITFHDMENMDLGYSITSAGDQNGDGVNDLLLGAPVANAARGAAYLYYGRTTWPGIVNVTRLDAGVEDAIIFVESTGSGFRRAALSRETGTAVALLGDVNDDGRPDLGIGAPGITANGTRVYVVFGTEATQAPSTAAPTPITLPPTTLPPSTPSPTASPTPIPCSDDGFTPAGSVCSGGVFTTSEDVAVPVTETPVTVASPIRVTGGSSFTQPQESILKFVVQVDAATGTFQATNIVVEDGGCASIAGDAVVAFNMDPSNGTSTTGTFTLVTSECLQGQFGSIAAEASFDSSDCATLGPGEQVATTRSISVSFPISRGCNEKSGSSLSKGAIAGVVIGSLVIAGAVTAVLLVWWRRRDEKLVKQSVQRRRMRTLTGV